VPSILFFYLTLTFACDLYYNIETNKQRITRDFMTVSRRFRRLAVIMAALVGLSFGCGGKEAQDKPIPATSLSETTDTGNVIDRKKITDAKGFALCHCFHLMNKDDSLSIMNKDASGGYFVENSTLSFYQFGAIDDFVEQNIDYFYAVSWNKGYNLITYICWSMYESDELDLFVKTLLKKDGPLSEKDTSGYGFRLTGSRSRASVLRVITQNITPLRYAYNERQRENPDSSNEAGVEFAVDEFGNVISARVAWTTIDDGEFIHFVENSVMTWDFGKIDKAGDTTEVTYRLRFEQ